MIGTSAQYCMQQLICYFEGRIHRCLFICFENEQAVDDMLQLQGKHVVHVMLSFVEGKRPHVALSVFSWINFDIKSETCIASVRIPNCCLFFEMKSRPPDCTTWHFVKSFTVIRFHNHVRARQSTSALFPNHCGLESESRPLKHALRCQHATNKIA